MVDYNPSVPVIVGQEWVPIRNQDLVFGENQAANSEVGTTFTLTSSTRVNNARFYLDDWVYGRFVNEGITAAIYPTGTENESGPIQKVVIPCTSGSVTGGITFSTPATDVPSALINPGTIRQSGLIFNAVAGFTSFRAQFGVMQAAYAALLAGKRILGVTLKTQIIVDSSLSVNSDDPISSSFDDSIEFGLRRIASDAVLFDWEFQPVYEIEAGANTGSVPRNSDVTRSDRLGNFSMYGATMLTAANTYPWTYEELTKFDSNFGASSVAVQVSANTLGANLPLIRFTYMALEVYYCEETRVAFGVKVFDAGPVTLGTEVRYRRGLNVVPLYDRTGATDPVLPAGDYTLTVAPTDFGDNFDITDRTNTSIKLNAIRELYTLPSFNAVEILHPTIMDDSALGETLQSQETVNVPQLSLHASGGAPLTEIHPYGRQIAAQVFGSNYAEQELLDTPVGSNESFPWVRFYARRWGDTTTPLTLTGQAGLAGSSVTLTPDEWDALSETLDGWKEVTLRFDTPPTMGTAGAVSWRFESTGELAGNRWEILGASAPAVSGGLGNLYTLAPSAQQLYLATYAPPTGSTQELVWTPQGIGSPPVSGAGTQDDSSDLFLIFSQDPVAVSGLGVETLCQPMSGIGQQCDVDPCCIPSALMFNQITWLTSAFDDADTFGYFELQRSDTVDVDWLTIMQGTSITGGVFNDFEARIGIETSYRIRAVNLYGFYGDWSDTVTATITAPGVTIGCDDGHILTFTSNERQSGEINLAYSSAWYEQRVEENFVFAESNFVQLQPMYDRDYFTAFRPTERGGEQFQRTVLVQAAAISPPTLGDFRSLRDMAWEDVSYICVRDEDGNRWFATVIVPNGRVLNNRKLYMASVQVVEVTDTPSPVDPADETVAGTVDGEVCEEA